MIFISLSHNRLPILVPISKHYTFPVCLFLQTMVLAAHNYFDIWCSQNQQTCKCCRPLLGRNPFLSVPLVTMFQNVYFTSYTCLITNRGPFLRRYGSNFMIIIVSRKPLHTSGQCFATLIVLQSWNCGYAKQIAEVEITHVRIQLIDDIRRSLGKCEQLLVDH